MKKQYLAPEIDIIVFSVEDVITHSLATSNGDNVVDFPSGWGFGLNGEIHTPWGVE